MLFFSFFFSFFFVVRGGLMGLNRMYTQRYTTVAIIVVLVILIGLILWFKLS